MKKLLRVLLVFIFAGLAGCPLSVPLDLLVSLDDGVVRGQYSGDARLFLKIPYAKPPLGELRWKAPQAVEPWGEDVRYETQFSEGCAQNADQGAPSSANEDCLYLNVWAPKKTIENAPVMVWIHGGGNFSGGANIPIPVLGVGLWYDGRYFAANNDVVVVTFNYRLGPMGFLSHAALSDEGEVVGNQGLLDQQMVLQWVQNNIEKFGGDPNNVTIFGESAGAGDVCYHMVSPASRGLFHRAIGQSGGCTTRPLASNNEKKSEMILFGEAIGCPSGSDQLSCMRRVPIETILDNANQPVMGTGGSSDPVAWSFNATTGGMNGVIPEHPRHYFETGDIAQVPYMLGTNNDEGSTFVWLAKRIKSVEEYQADLENRFGDFAEKVLEHYPPEDFENNYNLARETVVTDSGVVCSARDTALLASNAGLDVFTYNFNVAWSLLPSILKAGHAAEISHVFGKPFSWGWPIQSLNTIKSSQKVADAMNRYWATFAASGNPNFDGAPAVWPQFFSDTDLRLQLDSNWETLQHFKADKCAFWYTYYGIANPQ